ncbi:MAG: hypothetical protein H8E20_09775 [Verrucomicrobia bacterium]|nr:hypothetical protein [Verrucomicrobiota bacterium]
MPNARKVGKKNVSAWIDEDDKDVLQAAARERGVPLSEMLDELIQEKLTVLKNRRKKLKK